MTSKHPAPPRRRRRKQQLTFAPLAWLKLQFFCHSGNTEIGGFGITAESDPLYVEEFVTVRQRTSAMTVEMEDEAVANYSDDCVDRGLHPQNYLRIWCHTHPGSSPDPSCVDEETFARVFGTCDWAVMFILSRTDNTYARLAFNVGPGAAVPLPVSVDWATWPEITSDYFSMADLTIEWETEFAANIHSMEKLLPSTPRDAAALGSPWEAFADTWDWTEFDQQLLEEFEHDARQLDNPQP